jgi:hypothetical protein
MYPLSESASTRAWNDTKRFHGTPLALIAAVLCVVTTTYSQTLSHYIGCPYAPCPPVVKNHQLSVGIATLLASAGLYFSLFLCRAAVQQRNEARKRLREILEALPRLQIAPLVTPETIEYGGNQLAYCAGLVVRNEPRAPIARSVAREVTAHLTYPLCSADAHLEQHVEAKPVRVSGVWRPPTDGSATWIDAKAYPKTLGPVPFAVGQERILYLLFAFNLGDGIRKHVFGVSDQVLTQPFLQKTWGIDTMKIHWPSCNIKVELRGIDVEEDVFVEVSDLHAEDGPTVKILSQRSFRSPVA